MQRAEALKNIKNTPTVYTIQFQSASSTQGNEELASCYLPHTANTYHMRGQRSSRSSFQEGAHGRGVWQDKTYLTDPGVMTVSSQYTREGYEKLN